MKTEMLGVDAPRPQGDLIIMIRQLTYISNPTTLGPLASCSDAITVQSLRGA